MDRHDALDILAILIMIVFVFVPFMFLMWYIAWNYTFAFVLLMGLGIVPTSIVWAYHRLMS